MRSCVSTPPASLQPSALGGEPHQQMEAAMPHFSQLQGGEPHQRMEAAMRHFSEVQDGLVAMVQSIHTDLCKLADRLPEALEQESPRRFRHAGGPWNSSDKSPEGGLPRISKTTSLTSGVPDDWPRKLAMRQLGSRTTVGNQQAKVKLISNMSTYKLGRANTEEVIVPGTQPRLLRQIRDPNSAFHITFNLCGLVILALDLTVTPYSLAWDVPIEGAYLCFTWISAVFWSLDMVMGILRGFYLDGELIAPSWVRYLSTSFLPDLVVVGSDWASLATSLAVGADRSGAAGFRVLRFAKLVRLLRIVVLVRLLRYLSLCRRFLDTMLNEKVRLLLWLLSICFGALWFNHLMSCMWFLIGTNAPTDTGRRWIDLFERWPEAVAPEAQYMVAFQWSLAQLTLGAMDVQPSNVWERAFGILTMCLGFLFGSTMISLLSAALVDISMATKDRTYKLRILRQFLRENTVKRETSWAVQQQIMERLSETKRLTEQSVPALDLLSARLLSEVRYEIARAPLRSNGLFAFLHNHNIQWCHRLALEALKLKALSSQDDLFYPGVSANCAYCIVDGSISYLQEPATSFAVKTTETLVEKGRWLSESALWADWWHVGMATVQAPCQLVIVDSDRMAQALQGHSQVQKIVVAYCRQFHRRVVSAVPPESDYPTDLLVPCSEWEDIVLSMDQDIQITISLQASLNLELADPVTGAARLNWMAYKRPHEKLQEEILSGRSIVVLNTAGKPERITSKVSARITNFDDCIFAQIAKFRNSTAEPGCRLPSLKREGPELTSDTIRRLLTTKLKPLAGAAQLQRKETEVTQKLKGDGMETKYLRTICYMTVTGGIKAPSCSILQPFEEVRTDDPARLASGRSNFFEVQPATAAPGAERSAAGDCHMKFRDRLVYFLRDDATGGFYTWLTPKEFEHFEGPAGQEELRCWVSLLGVPPVEQASGLIRDL